MVCLSRISLLRLVVWFCMIPRPNRLVIGEKPQPPFASKGLVPAPIKPETSLPSTKPGPAKGGLPNMATNMALCLAYDPTTSPSCSFPMIPCLLANCPAMPILIFRLGTTSRSKLDRMFHLRNSELRLLPP